MLYFVKSEYAPNVLLTKENNLAGILDGLVAAGHAVTPPRVGTKSFFSMQALRDFMMVYADNPSYKVFELLPEGLIELSNLNRNREMEGEKE